MNHRFDTIENAEVPFWKSSVGRSVKSIILILIALIVILVVWSNCLYVLKPVGPTETGVMIRSGQIVNVVGPGVYNDFALFPKMEKYSNAEVKFKSEDPEVITKDRQRIGVVVTGSVFRPMYGAGTPKIRDWYIQYRAVYREDKALQDQMNSFGQQAMKTCVGDKTFNESVVGSSRDVLRECIDKQLQAYLDPFGLDVKNVMVPNVTLNPEVQAILDATTQSRLQTEKAAQDKLKADAEGLANLAQQQAAIRVEQGKQQEQTRQQTVLAQLQQEQLKAQQAVITQQKANDLLAAQKDLEINKAIAIAAAEKAKADIAKEIALAAVYSNNPAYLQYMMTSLTAQALSTKDKIIFTPNGVNPSIVFGNALPTVNVTP